VNEASIKEFVMKRGIEEEIKEEGEVQDYEKLDNTDIGRPSNNMTPINDLNFDDDVYETKKHNLPLTKSKGKKSTANRPTGVRGSKMGMNLEIT
jgi:hypothetical protein